MVGNPGRGYGWVQSRSAKMDDAAYRALLTRFAADHYDTSMFRRVPQTPEEAGQPATSD